MEIGCLNHSRTPHGGAELLTTAYFGRRCLLAIYLGLISANGIGREQGTA